LEVLEGMKSELKVCVRFRHRGLGNEALAQSGEICEACEVNFSQVLGGLGERVLEVHHRKQISNCNVPVPNTVADLAVLCANRHAMVHTNPKKAMAVGELRRRIAGATR
jgi:5-methylcytosine-specific restriction protein A